MLQKLESEEGDTCGLRRVNPKTAFCEVMRSVRVHSSRNIRRKISGLWYD
jgi:hypothetical protein